MKNIIIEECPYCGSKNLTKGYQTNDGMMFKDKVAAFGTVIEHTVCKDCASIITVRLKNPKF